MAASLPELNIGLWLLVMSGWAALWISDCIVTAVWRPTVRAIVSASALSAELAR